MFYGKWDASLAERGCQFTFLRIPPVLNPADS